VASAKLKLIEVVNDENDPFDDKSLVKSLDVKLSLPSQARLHTNMLYYGRRVDIQRYKQPFPA
jgi:hypothetical protein